MTRPIVTYPVSLADLAAIADAAGDMAMMKQFYVDQPAMIQQIDRTVKRLHDIVQRAADTDDNLIYIRADGSEVEE